MPADYKKVVVIGATSGIGEALAECLIQHGSFVIVVGRRKDRLESFVHQHGHENAQAVPLDITKLDSIPAFVTNVMNTHPDVDCIVLNSGMQRKCDFSDPTSVDIDLVQTELLTNYTAQLALTKAFLPYFMDRAAPSSLIFMSSGLSMVPIPSVSNYCATKAALHHWVLCLRENLRQTSVKVIEVFPPAVQTELHDVNPDIKDGRSMGMPLQDFTNEAYKELQAGEEQIPVGQAKRAFEGFEVKRQEAFGYMLRALKERK